MIELGSVDKKILNDIFNEGLSNPKNLFKYVSSYTTSSSSEENVKKNLGSHIIFWQKKFLKTVIK